MSSMTRARDATEAPFRDLERRLTRRRWAQLDLRLRVELVALALIVSGFLFWQARAPLDGLAHRGGPPAVVLAVAVVQVILAALAGVLAATRHARALRVGPPGPEWLALPVAPERLARHLAWDARQAGWAIGVPAAGVLAAAVGLIPAAWELALVAGSAWLLSVSSRLGAAVGQAWALGAAERRPGITPLACALGATSRPRRHRLRAATWSRTSPLWALVRKDIQLTGRLSAVARKAATAAMLWALALLAWGLPGEPALRHSAAFVLTLLAAASLAEWLAVLSGADPFAVLRGLPVGLAAVWGARFAWALLGLVLVVVGHAMAARELSTHALQVFLVWSGAATLGVATLGVNYGVTLFPRADLAQRLLALALGLAVAASIMIPLSGWVVLWMAVIHSARRLTHWHRLEEA